MSRLSHTRTSSPREAAPSCGLLLKRGTPRLARAKLTYGHRTQRPVDDAAALLAHALKLTRPLAARHLARPVSAAALARVGKQLQRPIHPPVPVVCLTGRACWPRLP